jgi:ADP-heptose:LPS heptosyltransferase
MYSFNVYTTPLNVSYLKINKTTSKNIPINVNKKKSLTWNNKIDVINTYSKEEYDRSIDHQTIRTNQINKMMNRLYDEPFEQPLQRGDTVFNGFTMWRK